MQPQTGTTESTAIATKGVRFTRALQIKVLQTGLMVPYYAMHHSSTVWLSLVVPLLLINVKLLWIHVLLHMSLLVWCWQPCYAAVRRAC
jgi:hypothetical protein